MSFDRRFELPTFEDEIEFCANCPSREVCHKLSYCTVEAYE